jgi:hypothetical protein
MASLLVARAPVDNGLKIALETYGLNAEIGEAPRDLILDDRGVLREPYSIIYPWPSLDLQGSMQDPEDQATLVYQITSVGSTRMSCQVQGDRVRRAIVERSPGGAFAHAISAGTSMTVIDRMTREIGQVVPEGGLWNVHDLYSLEVQAHA